MKVNVLGTEYEIVKGVTPKQDKMMAENDGYFDFSVKKIFVADFSSHGWNDKKIYENKVIRHELVHAFLYESGLSVNSDWAENEELVDWIAIQIPKMSKVFMELEKK